MRIKQSLGLAVATLYFAQNIALASIAESNFWVERHKSRLSIPALPIPSRIDTQNFKLRSFSRLAPSSKLGCVLQEIPLRFGSIREMYEGNKSSVPVLLIQDVHRNAEAQENIAGVLQRLIDAGVVNEVGVEGAFSKLNFVRLRAFINKDITRATAKDFLDAKLLAAPSYVGITSVKDPPPFIGVDDEAHHAKNVAAYLSSLSGKDRVSAEVSARLRTLEALESETFNPQLKAFDEQRRRYQKKQIELGFYLKGIAEMARGNVVVPAVLQQFLNASALEKSLDFKRVEAERGALLERLTALLSQKELQDLVSLSLGYQMGNLGSGDYYVELKNLCDQKGVSLHAAPEFDRYIRYTLLADHLKAEELFSATQDFESGLEDHFVQAPKERELLEASAQTRLTEKLIQFELTPEEWEKYKQVRHSGRSLAGIQVELDPGQKHAGMTTLQPFESFYREADIRSQRMVENLTGSKEDIGSKALVLIAGGFHTPRIAQFLKTQKISFAIVCPKVSKAEGMSGSDYLTEFSQEKTPLDRLLHGEQLFINDPRLNIGDPTTEGRFAMSVALRNAVNGLRNQFDGTGTRVLKIAGTTGYEITCSAIGGGLIYNLVGSASKTLDGYQQISAEPGGMFLFAQVQGGAFKDIGWFWLVPISFLLVTGIIIIMAILDTRSKERDQKSLNVLAEEARKIAFEARLANVKKLIDAKKSEFHSKTRENEMMRMDEVRALERFDRLIPVAEEIQRTAPQFLDQFMNQVLEPLLMLDAELINYILATYRGSLFFSFAERLKKPRVEIRAQFEALWARQFEHAMSSKKDWAVAKKFYYLPDLPIIVEDERLHPYRKERLLRAADLLVKLFRISERTGLPACLQFVESLAPHSTRDTFGLSDDRGTVMAHVAGRTERLVAVTIAYEGEHKAIQRNPRTLRATKEFENLIAGFEDWGIAELSPFTILVQELHARAFGCKILLDLWKMQSVENPKGELQEFNFFLEDDLKPAINAMRLMDSKMAGHQLPEEVLQWRNEILMRWVEIGERMRPYIQERPELTGAISEWMVERDALSNAERERIRAALTKDTELIPPTPVPEEPSKFASFAQESSRMASLGLILPLAETWMYQYVLLPFVQGQFGNLGYGPQASFWLAAIVVAAIFSFVHILLRWIKRGHPAWMDLGTAGILFGLSIFFTLPFHPFFKLPIHPFHISFLIHSLHNIFVLHLHSRGIALWWPVASPVPESKARQIELFLDSQQRVIDSFTEAGKPINDRTGRMELQTAQTAVFKMSEVFKIEVYAAMSGIKTIARIALEGKIDSSLAGFITEDPVNQQSQFGDLYVLKDETGKPIGFIVPDKVDVFCLEQLLKAAETESQLGFSFANAPPVVTYTEFARNARVVHKEQEEKKTGASAAAVILQRAMAYHPQTSSIEEPSKKDDARKPYSPAALTEFLTANESVSRKNPEAGMPIAQRRAATQLQQDRDRVVYVAETLKIHGSGVSGGLVGTLRWILGEPMSIPPAASLENSTEDFLLLPVGPQGKVTLLVPDSADWMWTIEMWMLANAKFQLSDDALPRIVTYAEFAKAGRELLPDLFQKKISGLEALDQISTQAEKKQGTLIRQSSPMELVAGLPAGPPAPVSPPAPGKETAKPASEVVPTAHPPRQVECEFDAHSTRLWLEVGGEYAYLVELPTDPNKKLKITRYDGDRKQPSDEKISGEFDIDSDIILGRGDEANFKSTGVALSRKHLSFKVSDVQDGKRKLTVTDLSRNGTTVRISFGGVDTHTGHKKGGSLRVVGNGVDKLSVEAGQTTFLIRSVDDRIFRITPFQKNYSVALTKSDHITTTSVGRLHGLIQIPSDETLSGSHFELRDFEQKEGRTSFTLEDLKSSGGTALVISLRQPSVNVPQVTPTRERFTPSQISGLSPTDVLARLATVTNPDTNVIVSETLAAQDAEQRTKTRSIRTVREQISQGIIVPMIVAGVERYVQIQDDGDVSAGQPFRLLNLQESEQYLQNYWRVVPVYERPAPGKVPAVRLELDQVRTALREGTILGLEMGNEAVFVVTPGLTLDQVLETPVNYDSSEIHYTSQPLYESEAQHALEEAATNNEVVVLPWLNYAIEDKSETRKMSLDKAAEDLFNSRIKVFRVTSKVVRGKVTTVQSNVQIVDIIADTSKPLTENSSPAFFVHRYNEMTASLKGPQSGSLPTAVAVKSVTPKQEPNEDAVLAQPVMGTVVIADGMGGHLAGEIASKIAAAWIDHRLVDLPPIAERDPQMMQDFSEQVVLEAHDIILKNAQIPRYRTMGTTIFVGILCKGKLVGAKVGNTRGLMQDGIKLKRVGGEDDEFRGRLYCYLGRPDEGQVAAFPKGKDGNLKLAENQLFQVDFPEGAIFLGVTDGVWKVVSMEKLEKIAAQYATENDLVERVVDAALAAATPDEADDITAVTLRVNRNGNGHAFKNADSAVNRRWFLVGSVINALSFFGAVVYFCHDSTAGVALVGVISFCVYFISQIAHPAIIQAYGDHEIAYHLGTRLAGFAAGLDKGDEQAARNRDTGRLIRVGFGRFGFWMWGKAGFLRNQQNAIVDTIVLTHELFPSHTAGMMAMVFLPTVMLVGLGRMLLFIFRILSQVVRRAIDLFFPDRANRLVSEAIVDIGLDFLRSGGGHAGQYVNLILPGRERLSRHVASIDGRGGLVAYLGRVMGSKEREARFLSDLQEVVTAKVRRGQIGFEEILPLLDQLAALGLPVRALDDRLEALPASQRVIVVTESTDAANEWRVRSAYRSAKLGQEIIVFAKTVTDVAYFESIKQKYRATEMATVRVVTQSEALLTGDILRLTGLKSRLAELSLSASLADTTLILSDKIGVDTAGIDEQELRRLTVIFLNALLASTEMNGITLNDLTKIARVLALQS